MKLLSLTCLAALVSAGWARTPIDAVPQINLTEHLQVQFDEPIPVAKARAIRGMGFRLVRFPVPALDRDFIIAQSVRNLLDAGLNVVLDFHPQSTREFQKTDEYFLLPALWRQIAVELRGQDLDRLAFEILNEPDYRGQPLERYDALLRLCIEAIRDVDPQRWIVASNPFLGDADYFKGPEGDWQPPKVPHLIVPMHYYRPFEITHSVRHLQSKGRVQPDAYPPVADESFTSKDYRNRDVHFRRYADWCRANKVTPWIGEAGCRSEVPGRLNWFRDVIASAARVKVPVCWWSMDGFALSARWDGRRYNVGSPDVLQLITGSRSR